MLMNVDYRSSEVAETLGELEGSALKQIKNAVNSWLCDNYCSNVIVVKSMSSGLSPD